LKLHGAIKHNHIGYCGVGFVIMDEGILYAHIDEQEVYLYGDLYQHDKNYCGIIKSFKTKEEFIDWLSQQSDDSLSGKEIDDPWYVNNQRITKQRLESLINNEKNA
jgi:hypothetical protein